MKKSDGKPTPAQLIEAAEFERLTTLAMCRAQRVAEKKAARYGLKLVLERPRKARAPRSRRVVEVA